MPDLTQPRWHALIPWLACLALWGAAGATEPTKPPVVHLRIVGGLAGVNQFTRHEEPFWSRDLPRLSQGSMTAEVVPFDKAGVRPQEILRLVQLGTVSFGTALLTLSGSQDPELFGPDLAGLNPDIGSVRRVATAFRPYLERLLKERYGAELLALYIYPAQETFCSKPLTGLKDLAGRRVRIANASQSDFLVALGAIPVQTSFAEVTANMRSGNIDCAVTGTMSGNTVGLHEHSRYLHTMPLGWGLAAFVANGASWQSLGPGHRALLRQELAKVERAIWEESDRETGEGIACNVGADSCKAGKRGSMTEVKESPVDRSLRLKTFSTAVLPGWINRCGPSCADLWSNTIRPASGFGQR